MASPAYEQLLAVQDLDLSLTQLRHRLAHHPLRAELGAVEEERVVLIERRDEIEGRRHELDRELRRLADEAASVEEKRAKSEAKLYDGSVTATKELLALQDESRSLLERQRHLEDEELEIMESLESVGAELDGVGAELAAMEARVAEINAALADATSDIEAEIERVDVARAAALEPVGPELLARYVALAPEFDGVPLARFVGGRCDGCHMQLSAMAVDLIAKTPADQPVTCEECGRLLVR